VLFSICTIVLLFLGGWDWVVPTKSCKTAVKQLLRLEIIVILGLGLPDAFCKNTGHFHRRILDFLGGGGQGRVHPDVYWLHISGDPTTLVTLYWQTRSINTVYTFWLNCIVTITQDYWDVSEAEAAFKTIQKIFSNLSNLKKVTCWMSEKFYY